LSYLASLCYLFCIGAYVVLQTSSIVILISVCKLSVNNYAASILDFIRSKVLFDICYFGLRNFVIIIL